MIFALLILLVIFTVASIGAYFGRWVFKESGRDPGMGARLGAILIFLPPQFVLWLVIVLLVPYVADEKRKNERTVYSAEPSADASA